MPYEINRSAVAKLLYGKRTYPDMIPIYPELAFRASMVQVTAQGKVGKHTGRTMKSIDVTASLRAPFWFFRVEAHTPYAWYHHRGTKPHTIVGSLEFRSHGRMVHTSVVHHPGTKPNPYLRDALPFFMRVHESARFRAQDSAMAAKYR